MVAEACCAFQGLMHAERVQANLYRWLAWSGDVETKFTVVAIRLEH